MSNIFENYIENKEVEDWIKLIPVKKHILSLKSKFPLAEKVSHHAVSICLEGVDRIMNKENKNILCDSTAWPSCIKHRKA